MRISNIRDWSGEDIGVVLFLAAITFAVSLAVFLLVKTVGADGKVDYCRVQLHERSNEYTGPLYIVQGHRPWREDVTMFVSSNREEADRKMGEICPH